MTNNTENKKKTHNHEIRRIRTQSQWLLSANIVTLILAIMIFIQSPPPIDVYNDYDYVDVIWSRAFVATLLLYGAGIVLLIINMVQMFKRKIVPRSKVVITLRTITILVFMGVTFYILGYLGFYYTLDINFMMPFRGYHPPF